MKDYAPGFVICKPCSTRRSRSAATDMADDAPKFTIAEHLDPDHEISRNADPLVEYTSYLSDVRSGTVGDLGFTEHVVRSECLVLA